MVFCYKIITESPRRSRDVSPGRKDKSWNVEATIANLLNDDELLESVPEREWRLLSALLRKRDDDEARERLAEQFRDLWSREREAKRMTEAQSHEQYRRYLDCKRARENSWLQQQQRQRCLSQLMKESQILDGIRFKERRSECLRANFNDKKKSDILDRALNLDARIYLAADRRHRSSEAEEWKKQVEWLHWKQRLAEANRRKHAMLRNASQRIATNNALSLWESAQIKQEVDALDVAKRAGYAINVALTEVRRKRLARAREKRMERARRVAELTSTLRDAVRNGKL